jgi:leucyl-tRNA synthetase
MDWTTAGAEGAYRFIGRVFRFVTRNVDRLDNPNPVGSEADRRVLRKLHQTIDKISDDFDSRWHFNTSIAAFMELVNELYAREPELSGAALSEVLEKIVLLLAPFTPYVCEEMWEILGRTGPVFKQRWPVFDPELAKEEGAEVVLQVNGKVRSRLFVNLGLDAETLRQMALADVKIAPYLDGKQIIKIIVVPDKLVNIVVK